MRFSLHANGGSSLTSELDDELVSRMADDPWGLPLADRVRLAGQHASVQQTWLPRLRRLVEPPLPRDNFPAFLLELPAFARLRRSIGDATQIADLDVGTADELQRFVDRYRGYLGQPTDQPAL